jgi:hypothetical protein
MNSQTKKTIGIVTWLCLVEAETMEKEKRKRKKRRPGMASCSLVMAVFRSLVRRP